MKTAKSIIVVLFVLLTAQMASAYYCPSTGRWLSRDPICEPGFQALQATAIAPRIGNSASSQTARWIYRGAISVRNEPNAYQFVGNNPTVTIDKLGLVGFGDLRQSERCCQCGPDVTAALERTLANIAWIFDLWDDDTADAACNQLVNPNGAYGKAWDISELSKLGFDKTSCDCMRTVTVNGKCYYGSAVNYAMWGKACSLCEHRFGGPQWDSVTALLLATMHKEFETPGGLDAEGREAVAFTSYGYNGFLPSGGTDKCQPNSSPIKNYAFHWKWLPAKNVFK